MLNAATELQREGLSINEACMVAGIGHGAVVDRILKAHKHGKRTLILCTDLLEFLKVLLSATE